MRLADHAVTIGIGLAAGWVTGLLAKGRGFGWIGNLIVGALGALLGQWLFGLAGIRAASVFGRFVCATLGAIVLLALLNFAFGSRGKA